MVARSVNGGPQHVGTNSPANNRAWAWNRRISMSAPRIPRPAAFSGPQFGLLMVVALALWGLLALAVMGGIVLWRVLGGWAS